MANSPDRLRTHVVQLLDGGSAHVNLDETLRAVPPALRGVCPPKARHTLWELLEHLRIAQWDIVEFSRNPHHVSPEFPGGYWPQEAAPKDPATWDQAVSAARADLQAMKDLVADPANDLLAPIPHGTGQTLLREALVLADHNSYHLGQMLLVRRLLGIWPPADA